MSLRSEYEAAKRNYHKTGEALRKRHSAATTKAYQGAKREYHSLGKKLAKKGR
jgi:hypothetical protein